MADTLTDTAQIEADIARTRERLDGRLDQLQDHLSPRQMLNDAFAYFRGGEGAEITQDLFTRARANPMPLALVGVGVAWLMASSGDSTAPARSNAGGPANRTRLPYPSTADATTHAASGAPHLARGTQTMAHSTRDTIASLATNPFALGAIAAVVGAVAGSLLPTLDQEEAALGATAGKLREKGRDLAQDLVDRGTQVVGETLDAAKDSAGSHGLTPDKPIGDVVADLRSGELASNVKQVARETLQAGHDTARDKLASQNDG